MGNLVSHYYIRRDAVKVLRENKYPSSIDEFFKNFKMNRFVYDINYEKYKNLVLGAYTFELLKRNRKTYYLNVWETKHPWDKVNLLRIDEAQVKI